MNKKLSLGQPFCPGSCFSSLWKNIRLTKDIITMRRGDTITVSEFYDKVKSNPSAPASFVEFNN